MHSTGRERRKASVVNDTSAASAVQHAISSRSDVGGGGRRPGITSELLLPNYGTWRHSFTTVTKAATGHDPARTEFIHKIIRRRKRQLGAILD